MLLFLLALAILHTAVGTGLGAAAHAHEQQAMMQRFARELQSSSPLRKVTQHLVDSFVGAAAAAATSADSGAEAASALDVDALHAKVSAAFLSAAGPIFLELAAAVQAQQRLAGGGSTSVAATAAALSSTSAAESASASASASALASASASAAASTAASTAASVAVRNPFDPASGLSEPTADCRRLLSGWMAKCAFGPRPL
jgi:hypothetical protein